MLRKSLQIFTVVLFGLLFLFSVSGQETVDKTVAVVNDGIRPTELITYSDLLWQLALEPETPISPPSDEDLNRALQLLINQRLIVLEAQRLPTISPKEEEVRAEITRIVGMFPSITAFASRLQDVGFNSINDDNFRKIIEQRVAISKYLDFRFRSFVVITPEDEAGYYKDIFVPKFRRENPDKIIPQLTDVRQRINAALTEDKIESDIDKFLDNAKNRAEIIVLLSSETETKRSKKSDN